MKFNLFTKKIKTMVLGLFDSIDSGTILTNDHVSIVHSACRICVGKPPLEDYEAKLKNIEMVVGRGHESVLEHSNIIMYLIVPNKHLVDLLEITEHFKYLNYKTKFENGNVKMLIGGSIRGYKHVFRELKNPNNVILDYIRQELYVSANKEYFVDFIEAGIMKENQFKRERISAIGVEDTDCDFTLEDAEKNYKDEVNSGKTFEIISMDNIKHLADMVADLGGFDYDDLLDLCTVTILFKDISRAISQQFTRHRNATSQESQRYVDYSQSKFINPIQFKPDKYDPSKKYEIQLERDNIYNLTSDELADLLVRIYPQLREQGMDKEDARGFSLFNVDTKFIMTFTFRHLIKFLELRTHKSAQPEIRESAIELESLCINRLESVIGNIYKYLLPKYMVQEVEYDYESIDEAMGEIEEVIEEIEDEKQ